MDEKTAEGLERLLDQILDVSDKLGRVEEQQFWKPTDVAACHQALDGVVARYQQLLAAVPEDEKPQVERHYGRKVMDLRRDNDWLPERSRGRAVPLATGNQWSRATDHKAPPPPAASQQAVLRPVRAPSRPKGPHVGGEIEAWCGTCKGLREHTIVAMVGDEPKQVLCESCGARHGFRLEPARPKKKPPTSKRKSAKQSQKELEEQRKEAERQAFLRELDEAKEIKELSRHVRYRSGEIIDHPEHGRGKIEHVVKGSLLVRFRSGLKPVNL